jgi:hypothetical protein
VITCRLLGHAIGLRVAAIEGQSGGAWPGGRLMRMRLGDGTAGGADPDPATRRQRQGPVRIDVARRLQQAAT